MEKMYNLLLCVSKMKTIHVGVASSQAFVIFSSLHVICVSTFIIIYTALKLIVVFI